jgi:hypothetical protein
MIRLCSGCMAPVRPGKRGDFFHALPGYPGLETIARETKEYDEQQAKTPGVVQQKSPTDSMEVEIEGY